MDVYPIVIMGRGRQNGQAFGQVALRGKTAIKVTHKRLGAIDSGDPLGQRGYVGALTWQAQLIQNDAWMAVVFVGAES
jgi:N4-gp56 family major capsid protein